MNVEIVTSMNHEYCSRYGARMMNSFICVVDRSVSFRLYHEGSRENMSSQHYTISDRITPIDLYKSTAYGIFEEAARKRVQEMVGKVEIDPYIRWQKKSYNYGWDALTFGKKAFAWIHAARNSKARYLFWVDADVIFRKGMPESVFTDLFKDSPDIVYFRRDFPHAETGFYGIDLKSERSVPFVEYYASLWEKLGILSNKTGWTDSHAFDMSVLAGGKWKLKAKNLSTKPRGHVIAESPLGIYIDHLKGPRKNFAKSPEAK